MRALTVLLMTLPPPDAAEAMRRHCPEEGPLHIPAKG
jgi:hypothetical protein